MNKEKETACHSCTKQGEKNWKLKFMAVECFNIWKIELSLDSCGSTLRHKIYLENEKDVADMFGTCTTFPGLLWIFHFGRHVCVRLDYFGFSSFPISLTFSL